MIAKLRATAAHLGFVTTDYSKAHYSDPVNKWQYENAETFGCAAAYAFGVAKAHAFVDGNKRTAFVTSVTFLRLNGWHFVTEPVEGVTFMEDLASGAVSEESFRNWLEQSSTKIK
jgi:death-on-curing protein